MDKMSIFKSPSRDDYPIGSWNKFEPSFDFLKTVRNSNNTCIF